MGLNSGTIHWLDSIPVKHTTPCTRVARNVSARSEYRPVRGRGRRHRARSGAPVPRCPVVDEHVVHADAVQRGRLVGVAGRGQHRHPARLARTAVAIPTEEVPPRMRIVCPG